MRNFRLSLSVALTCLRLALCLAPIAAQAGVTEDWAQRHVVFSRPGKEPSLANRAAHWRWSKIVADPRFRAQAKAFAAVAAKRAANPITEFRYIGPPRRAPVQRDWAMNMVSASTGSTARVNTDVTPAKYSFDAGLTPFCDDAAQPDFVVYTTGATGNTQADIVAYDNLYKAPTCSGPVPLVYFQYRMTGAMPGPPVISYDGRQIAVVAISGGVARLLLIKWAKNPALVQLTPVATASYRTCTAPCMTSITLAGSPNSTNATPFYDYNSDSIYVTANNGTVHKFINIFLSGTPTEITTATAASGWPLTIHTAALPAGVLDPVSNMFLVGSGKQFARIPAGGGTANIVETAAANMACDFSSSPIVDVTVGRVYMMAADHAVSPASPGTCGAPSASARPALLEYTNNFTAGAAAVATVNIGSGSARSTFRNAPSGTFDDAYFNSTPGNPSGSFYACVHSPTPRLVQFTISGNVASSVTLGPLLNSTTSPTNASPPPSCTAPIEFFDGVTDRIFVGVYTGVRTTAGTYTCGAGPLAGASSIGSGCIMSFNVTQPFSFSATTAASAVLPIAGGGPTNVSIDNRAPGGGSQVYFRTIMPQVCTGNGTTGAGTGYCAVQASQNGLN